VRRRRWDLRRWRGAWPEVGSAGSWMPWFARRSDRRGLAAFFRQGCRVAKMPSKTPVILPEPVRGFCVDLAGSTPPPVARPRPASAPSASHHVCRRLLPLARPSLPSALSLVRHAAGRPPFATPHRPSARISAWRMKETLAAGSVLMSDGSTRSCRDLCFGSARSRHPGAAGALCEPSRPPPRPKRTGVERQIVAASFGAP
jgi:hypothetical protein